MLSLDLAHLRHFTWRLAVSGVAVCCLLLAACGQSSDAGSTQIKLAQTFTPTVSAPQTTPIPANSPVLSGTPCTTQVTPTDQRVGDFVISAPAPTGTLFVRLPDAQPVKPFAIPTQASNGQFPGWPASQNLGTSALLLTVCNLATVSHALTGLTVTISNVTKFSGTVLQAWDYCTGTYDHTKGVVPVNCNHPAAANVQFKAPFAATAPVNTKVTADGVVVANGTTTPIPAILPAGEGATFEVDFTPPTARGQYTFALSLQFDGKPLSPLASPALLLGTIDHLWDAPSCTSSTMQSQIAATGQFICPKA